MRLCRPWSRLAAAVAVAAGLGALAPADARAAASLTVTPITWNVIGLDSNSPTSGPNRFPVGVRVCNTGDAAAATTTASFVWDSANANIALSDAAVRPLGSLAAGACTDAYWTAVVTQTSAAFDTARRYHVEVTASGLATVSTPTPRELYVEKLVSQNRNAVNSLTGPTTVREGSRVTYTLSAKTATGGYEQLEVATIFPSTIFRMVSTAVTYTAPAGGTNTTMYADACGWDNLPTSGTYRSCVGPVNYTGGKAGGTITTTFTLDVIGAGSSALNTIIYDFSGSSYHYNSDYSSSVTSITATPNTPPVATNDSASTSPSTAVTISVLANDSDANGDTLTITGSSTPGNGSVTCTATQCTYSPSGGFTGTDTFTYTIADGYGGTATATVTVTVAAVVPLLGIDSPLPVVLLTVGLALLALRRRPGRAQ